jgi:hypothetical protein
MSYSYVQTVFPEFKYSKIYDLNVYNTTPVPPSKLETITPANIENDFQPKIANVQIDNSAFNTNEFLGGQPGDNLHFYNKPILNNNVPNGLNLNLKNPTGLVEANSIAAPVGPIGYLGLNKNQVVNNSLIQPLNQMIQPNQQLNQMNQPLNQMRDNIERTEQFTSLSDTDHKSYINHILQCQSCKEIIMKQLNIEARQQFYEEILELISFIVFGIFILLLLDK